MLAADVKLSELKREQDFVMKKFERGDMSVQDRMQEIDEELLAMGADSAEPRARRILSGLGFTEKMQSRATKGMRAYRNRPIHLRMRVSRSLATLREWVRRARSKNRNNCAPGLLNFFLILLTVSVQI